MSFLSNPRLRILLGVAGALALAGLAYGVYRQYLAPVAATPTPASGTPAGAEAPSVVTAEGKIIPARDATLAFRLSGRVAAIPVKEGQAVKAGDVLVQLEDADLQAVVAEAEAAVALAQANLDQLLAGPRPEEIAAAEARYRAAQSGVGQAVAQRDEIKSAPTADRLAAAQAQLAQAQTAEAQAANDYDQLIDHKLYGWVEEEARYRLNAAHQAVAAAQAAIDQLNKGASADTVQAYNSAVGVTAYQRDAAKAQLDLLKAGATKEQIAAAQAQVAQAQAALDAAQANLAQATLAAPFGGTVVSVSTEVGEMAVPGAPLVVLADFSTWRMKTTDLAETDVVLVAPGQSASVTLDAFPGQTFKGTVTEISNLAETNRGNTTYAVTIALDPVTAALRWGMTAFADISVTP
jgi:multidrug efflux pump subunit AcrA (membrane-fusion protein)